MMAAAPARAQFEDGFCTGCGVELGRFNRACLHMRMCLGCQDAAESTDDEWPAGVPLVDRAPAGATEPGTQP